VAAHRRGTGAAPVTVSRVTVVDAAALRTAQQTTLLIGVRRRWHRAVRTRLLQLMLREKGEFT